MLDGFTRQVGKRSDKFSKSQETQSSLKKAAWQKEAINFSLKTLAINNKGI